MTLSHEDRAARRKSIARLVDCGTPIEAVASRFGVSRSTAANACREHGVMVARQSKGRPMRDRTLEILAELQADPPRLFRAIAIDAGVSIARVQQIHRQALRAGVRMAKRGDSHDA